MQTVETQTSDLMGTLRDAPIFKGDGIRSNSPRREKRRRSRCGTLAPFIVQVHQLKIHGVNAARNSSASRRKKLLCGEDLCGLLNGKREGFLFEKRFPSPMQST